MNEEISDAIIEAAIFELGENVVEAIREDERELIIEMLRSDDWANESCEDAANAIEDFEHYPDEDLH